MKPLACTHLVQLLVDVFILISPLALCATLGVYSIPCVGILTLFYTGLLDMAKIFLDPLHNQDFTRHSKKLGMDLGVLTRESNELSALWKNTGASLPFDMETTGTIKASTIKASAIRASTNAAQIPGLASMGSQNVRRRGSRRRKSSIHQQLDVQQKSGFVAAMKRQSKILQMKEEEEEKKLEEARRRRFELEKQQDEAFFDNLEKGMLHSMRIESSTPQKFWDV